MATLSTGPFRPADLIQFRFTRGGSPFRDKQQKGLTLRIEHSSSPSNLKMGGSVSKIMNKLFANREMRILMLGLDAAGKTSNSNP
jgi:hypothetical protein